MPREQNKRPRTAHDTAAWALQYLLVQLAVVLAAAALQAYLGAPPWTLRHDGDHLATLARVSLWVSLVSGVADALTGELTQNYASWAHACGYTAVWLATCAAQIVCVVIDAVPPLAAVLVALGCQVVAVVAHTALADARQWPYPPTTAYLRAYGVLRWALAAVLLLATSSAGAIASAPRLLAYVVGVQALWQIYAWAQALQSSVLQVFGLHTVVLLATHAVCVRVVWRAGGLGWAHAAAGVYTCWALGAAICEARFPLPFLAEEVNTRIWCAAAQTPRFPRLHAPGELHTSASDIRHLSHQFRACKCVDGGAVPPQLQAAQCRRGFAHAGRASTTPRSIRSSPSRPSSPRRTPPCACHLDPARAATWALQSSSAPTSCSLRCAAPRARDSSDRRALRLCFCVLCSCYVQRHAQCCAGALVYAVFWQCSFARWRKLARAKHARAML